MSDDPRNVKTAPVTQTPEVPARRLYYLTFVADLGSAGRLRGLAEVDHDRFAELLHRAAPELALAVKPPGGGGPDWEFRLRLDTLRAFEPAGFLPQVGGARWRLGAREKLSQRKLGQIGASELDAALRAAGQADPSLSWLTHEPGSAAAPSSATPVAPASGGSILDLVDAPQEASRVSADIRRLATSAGDPAARLAAPEAQHISTLLGRINLELQAISDAVLHHPDFQRLEAAWRALKFLVDRLDFRAGVRLTVLDAPRGELVASVIEHVIDPAFDGHIATPGLLLLDYAISNTPVDLGLLEELAPHAAGLPTPVVFPIDAQFFNVKSLRMLKNLPSLAGLLDSWQFAKWKSLRDKPYSKALVPVVGRFVLRGPYTPQSDDREFVPAEGIQAVTDLLWGGGHLALGLCAARAYATHGWPTRMFGAQAGKIENLPLIANPHDAQNSWGPGDLVLPDRRVDELPLVGMNLLLSVPQNDHCLLLGGVCAARPRPTADVGPQQAALEISLPYQQVSNIVGAFLCELRPTLRGLDAAEIQKRLLLALQDLLRLSAEDAEAVQVGVGPAPQTPGEVLVQVRVTPPARIVPGGLHADFSFSV
jgi:type VI secretion system protein ImpC